MDHCPALREAEPDSVPVLEVLELRGVLHARCGETGQPAAELLHRLLATRRFEGFDGRHLYWGALERLYEPATNSQLIFVPFSGGGLHADTCVSAARAFILLWSCPAEYLRLVERLTAPENGFAIRRRYTAPDFEAQRDWLSGAFPFVQIGSSALWIWICADAAAPERALAEHEGRRWREYDFGAREWKNSRLLVDVMVQSALTNYALRGRYDSVSDCHRDTEEQGVAFGSPGYEALDRYVSSVPRELVRQVEQVHRLARPMLVDVG
ncbi:hypothetical protein [Streptomyces sp. ODS28]|uniref:hypothetical protein n=1 Tax=Streptomyces sp. ODS28 TaxID=3136688 RepID=UPI0031E84D81